ncbi:MAG: hypothetical protein ACLR0N_10210 [Bilophila wadsworthia]
MKANITSPRPLVRRRSHHQSTGTVSPAGRPRPDPDPEGDRVVWKASIIKLEFAE